MFVAKLVNCKSILNFFLFLNKPFYILLCLFYIKFPIGAKLHNLMPYNILAGRF